MREMHRPPGGGPDRPRDRVTINFEGADRIGVLVRHPESVYVYWRLEGARSAEVVRDLGGECQWVLRVLDLTENSSETFPVQPEAGNSYVEVKPGRTYGFELAVTARGKWRTVCRTERVEVPPAKQVPGAEAPAPVLERLRPGTPDRDVPGLRYETTLPYLATSPGPRSTEGG